MKYTKDNFFVATVADWTRAEIPERTPDYVSYSGSAYWFYPHSVRRQSDHWGEVRTCRWFLEGRDIHVFACAECDFDEFRSVLALHNPIT